MVIDLKTILRDTGSSAYGDLVTRPTGKAVRGGIEKALRHTDGHRVAVIDFTTVRTLDFSCADEIVGKLLLEHQGVRYFLLTGVSAAHCDAIEPVLERHGLAVAARDRDGRVTVLGPLDETARRTFVALSAAGPARPDELASSLAADPRDVERALEVLQDRGLVLLDADRYTALTAE
jgi:hypothetical protein